MTPHDIARFWSKADVGQQTQCWNWLGSCRTTGYGSFRLNGQLLQAHRVAYEIFYSAPSDNTLYVLHFCDNRKCVNPFHLHLGTHADNMREASERGGFKRGYDNHAAKFTDETIVEMRKMYAAGGFSGRALSKHFGIGRDYVYEVVTGRERLSAGGPIVRHAKGRYGSLVKVEDLGGAK